VRYWQNRQFTDEKDEAITSWRTFTTVALTTDDCLAS
jgi:hypothetical protein